MYATARVEIADFTAIFVDVDMCVVVFAPANEVAVGVTLSDFLTRAGRIVAACVGRRLERVIAKIGENDEADRPPSLAPRNPNFDVYLPDPPAETRCRRCGGPLA